MTREELRDAIASVAYDDFEGPIANQDYGRQVRQWEQCKRIADAQIAAIEAAGVRLVPAEATLEMRDKGFLGGLAALGTPAQDTYGGIFRAMIAASPYAKDTI